jgi:hypothetical protein
LNFLNAQTQHHGQRRTVAISNSVIATQEHAGNVKNPKRFRDRARDEVRQRQVAVLCPHSKSNRP